VRRLAILAVALSLGLACAPDPDQAGPTAANPVGISYVRPIAGHNGDQVTIHGFGFRPGSTVRFSAEKIPGLAATVVSITETTIVVRTPELPNSPHDIVVDVTVTTPIGETATRRDVFKRLKGGPFSGTVFELTTAGVKGPVPNLRLKVRWRPGLNFFDLRDVVTDAHGRYTVHNPPDPPYTYFHVDPASEYRMLCPVWLVYRDLGPFGQGNRDLPVVHKSWAGNTLPPNSWITGALTGFVTERINGVSQPLEGATVSGFFDIPAVTNAAGFYVMCEENGAEQQPDKYILKAEKPGYNTVSRPWGGDTNFELTRIGASTNGK
jgi:hypothetical protein